MARQLKRTALLLLILSALGCLGSPPDLKLDDESDDDVEPYRHERGEPEPRNDINGDGFGDIVIGATGQTTGNGLLGGTVSVVSDMEDVGNGGGGSAQRAVARHVLNGESAGLDNKHEGDSYGTALATGDFTGDGCADIAIGVPGEDDAELGFLDTGAVVLVSGAGPTCSDSVPKTLQTIKTTAKDLGEDAGFGHALVADHFNDDSCLDLAIGAPWGRADGLTGKMTGIVDIYYGDCSSSKPLSFGKRLAGSARDDAFGLSLASGNIDNLGCADLVVGAPGALGYDSAGIKSTGYGQAHIFRGCFGSAELEAWQILPKKQGAEVTTYAFSQFGSAVAVGDFDGDSRGEVAIGARGHKGSGSAFEGAVFVYDDNASWGLKQSLHGDNLASGGAMGFGTSLAVGRFDGDARDDLAIGVPGAVLPQDYEYVTAAGAVAIYRGNSNQLQFMQELSEPESRRTSFALFGGAIAATDHDGDQLDGLVIGVPGKGGVGAAWLYEWSATSMSVDRQFEIVQASTTPPAPGRRFGVSLPGSPRYRRRMVIEVDSAFWGPHAPCENSPSPEYCGAASIPSRSIPGAAIGVEKSRSIESVFGAAGIDISIQRGSALKISDDWLNLNELTSLRLSQMDIGSSGDLYAGWCFYGVGGAGALADTAAGLFSWVKSPVRDGCFVMEKPHLEAKKSDSHEALSFAQAIGFMLNLTRAHADPDYNFCQDGTVMGGAKIFDLKQVLGRNSKWHLQNYLEPNVQPGLDAKPWRTYAGPGTYGVQVPLDLPNHPELCPGATVSPQSKIPADRPFVYVYK